MNKACVSIVVAVYNCEKFLPQFIESVTEQDYDNWELILVNDGSTDSSEAICRHYEQMHWNKIFVVSTPNNGSLIARRIGLQRINGEYFMILDADDVLLPGALKHIVETFNSTMVDMVMYNSGERDGTSINGDLFKEGKLKSADVFNFKKLIIESSEHNHLWTKAWKVSIIDYNNKEFYEKHKNQRKGTDLLQLLPLLNTVQTAAYINKGLYWYRTNNQSISHTYWENFFQYMQVLGASRRHYAKVWGLDEKLAVPLCYREICSVLKNLSKCKKKTDYAFINNKLLEIETSSYFKQLADISSVGIQPLTVFFLIWLLKLRANVFLFLLIYLAK